MAKGEDDDEGERVKRSENIEEEIGMTKGPVSGLLQELLIHQTARLRPCFSLPVSRDRAVRVRQGPYSRPRKSVRSVLMRLIYLIKLPVHIFEHLQYLRIEMLRHCPAVAFGYNFKNLFMFQRRLVRSFAS